MQLTPYFKFRFSLTLVALTALGCGHRPPTTFTQVAPISTLERDELHRKLRAGEPILPPSSPAANAALVTTLLPSPAPSSEPIDPTPRPSVALVQAQECRQFRAQIPADWVQGTLTVPEDYNQPLGAQVQVFYYARLIRDSQNLVIRPVVFFNGGPGSDSHSSFSVIEHRSSAQNLSMIYIDQRGTGCSSAYPSSLANIRVDADSARKLTLYGSRSIVRDAEAIRAHLLGPQTLWTVYGQSYGGDIVQRYLEIAPVGILAAFAHGSALSSDPTRKLVERLRSQFRVSQDYFTLYPDDRGRLQEIRAAIAATRCFEDGSTRVCGPEIVDAGTILLGFRTQWDSLHQWVGRLLGRSHQLSEPMLGEFVRTFVFGVYGRSGFAAAVLSYMEIVPGFTDALGCQAAIRSLREQANPATDRVDPSEWPINECRLLMAMHAPWDPVISRLGSGDPVSIEGVALTLDRFPLIRFFLYSGSKDVFVPTALFQEEVSRLGTRVTYRNFPESGHDGFVTEQAIWNDLLSI